MTRCLVTGGAGFIGAHVARELLDAGHDVVVLDDLSGGFRENVDPRARFVQGSVCDPALVDGLFEDGGFPWVFHLAAYAAENLSHFIKRFNYTNNLIGSVNLINAAVNHGSECFVFTSSIAVYGQAQLPMSENVPPEPEDSYGIAKLAVEHELAITREMFGLESVIFRPHNVYGELQNIGDMYRNVVGIFINQILKGEPLTIFGDGEQTRAFTYIGDVAPAIARAPGLPAARNRIFNIGASEPCTVNALADAVRRHMGVPDHPVEHLRARAEVKHAWSDHGRVQSVFGPAAATGLEDGVARMVGWARQVGARESRRIDEIEIPQGLPEIWTRGD